MCEVESTTVVQQPLHGQGYTTITYEIKQLGFLGEKGLLR